MQKYEISINQKVLRITVAEATEKIHLHFAIAIILSRNVVKNNIKFAKSRGYSQLTVDRMLLTNEHNLLNVRFVSLLLAASTFNRMMTGCLMTDTIMYMHNTSEQGRS